jgi:hypothetical protein
VGTVYPAMWACWSGNWNTADAYFHRRVCAGPDPKTGLFGPPDRKTGRYNRNCVATPVGPCEDTLLKKQRRVCLNDNRPPTGDYDFGDCRDPQGRVWSRPITTLLNHPCELLPPAEHAWCTTVSPVPVPDPTSR